MAAGLSVTVASLRRKQKMQKRADKCIIDGRKTNVERDEEMQIANAKINLRENFNALAVFAPSVKTDSSGKAIGSREIARQSDALSNNGDCG